MSCTTRICVGKSLDAGDGVRRNGWNGSWGRGRVWYTMTTSYSGFTLTANGAVGKCFHDWLPWGYRNLVWCFYYTFSKRTGTGGIKPSIYSSLRTISEEMAKGCPRFIPEEHGFPEGEQGGGMRRIKDSKDSSRKPGRTPLLYFGSLLCPGIREFLVPLGNLRLQQREGCDAQRRQNTEK